jgi:hypothetical protein
MARASLTRNSDRETAGDEPVPVKG